MDNGRRETIRFSCHGCGRIVALPLSAAGKRIGCCGCGLRSTIPKPNLASHFCLPSLKPHQAESGGSMKNKASPLAESNSHQHCFLKIEQHTTFMAVAAALFAAVFLTASFLPSSTLVQLGEPMPPTTDAESAQPVGLSPTNMRLEPGASGEAVSVARTVDLLGRSEQATRLALLPLADRMHTLIKQPSMPPTLLVEAALLRLTMYRRLCGLPEEDLVIDERLNREAVAAADVCRRLGYLSHTPPNPNVHAAAYELALRGAGSGNLASGMRDLVAAIDAWMDDSDADNIATLGHRRWCLNPPLKRLGFGQAGRYFVMWAHDESGQRRFEQPAICFPPAGHVPIDMFRPNHAWSVTLNTRHFAKPNINEIGIDIRDGGISGGENSGPLTMNFLAAENSGYGVPNCIIFRPDDLLTAVGKNYRITITGLQDHDGQPICLRFSTTFMEPIH